VKSRSNCCNSI